MKIASIISLFLILTIGCNLNRNINKQQNSCFKEFPGSMVDMSTPENTIKTLWKWRIWYDTSLMVLPIQSFYFLVTKETKDTLNHQGNNSYKELGTKHPYNINSIDTVIFETQSRVLITTREFFLNDSPESCFHHKYILLKQGSKWYIDSKFQRCFYCEGTGKTEIFETEELETCPWCDGKGFIESWR